MFCCVPGGGPCATRVMLLPVRWLVVRANPVENRNVFCRGMEGKGVHERCDRPQGVSHPCAQGEIA